MDTIRDDQTKIIFNNTLCRMMFVGQGFVTSQNVKGQILGLDSKGNVSAYKRLYDQKSLDELFPRAVTAMKSNWVMISSQVSCDQIPIGSIVRLNMVLPVALTSTNRSDNFFIAGVLQFPPPSISSDVLREPKTRPVQGFGVQSVNPRDLIQMIHQITTLTATCDLKSFLPALRAQLEDFILQSSVRKAEDDVSIRKKNTLDITAVPPEVVVALLHDMTPADKDSRSVGYCENVLSIEWAAGWDVLESVFGRNCSRTEIPALGGNIFEAGKPRFKYLLLPFPKVELSLQYTKLLSAGAMMEIWSNKDTDGAIREHNSFPRLPQCKTCMRLMRSQHITHACTCESGPELNDYSDHPDPPSSGDEVIELQGVRPEANVPADAQQIQAAASDAASLGPVEGLAEDLTAADVEARIAAPAVAPMETTDLASLNKDLQQSFKNRRRRRIASRVGMPLNDKSAVECAT
jgi:hypothetical protein